MQPFLQKTLRIRPRFTIFVSSLKYMMAEFDVRWSNTSILHAGKAVDG